MYFSVYCYIYHATPVNNFRQLFLVIQVPKNSNFSQNLNFLEK
jgi:hypothetical protein